MCPFKGKGLVLFWETTHGLNSETQPLNQRLKAFLEPDDSLCFAGSTDPNCQEGVDLRLGINLGGGGGNRGGGSKSSVLVLPSKRKSNLGRYPVEPPVHQF